MSIYFIEPSTFQFYDEKNGKGKTILAGLDSLHLNIFYAKSFAQVFDTKMSHNKTEVLKKTSSQISVSDRTTDSLPQVSSAFKCSTKTSAWKKSVSSKLFSWNKEKPRQTSEYVEKNYKDPFNEVAPELRVIGGLGQIKCVAKQEQQPLVNRPTQVQKLWHTKTRLLPNFPLTEQLRPTACPRKQKLSVTQAAERVKFAENLPSPPSSSSLMGQSKTKDSFNHQNPFNLDLNALSKYQKQKYYAEEIERRRNYQIIRRTMETKELKSEGVERIKQAARDEKFQLPTLFKVGETIENIETGDSKKEINLMN